MRLHYGLFFLSFFFFQVLHAQSFSGGKTEQQIEQQAFTFFDGEDFINALPLYQELINVYPQDPEYNYYLGVCQVEVNENIKEAIQHLKIASTKNVNASVPYYLGRAFHMNYEFNSAIRYYRKFREYYKKKSIGIDRLIEMCQNGLPLVNSYYIVDVKKKKVVARNEFFRYYELEGFEDRLSKKDNSLTSRNDGEGDKEVACLANKGQYIYFSSFGKSKKTGRDLYRAKRLRNGGWGEWEELTSLNSPYDEVYPFMSNDGRTLYFCSQGHTSMGGFDIFKSIYNEISDTWTEPQNMGFPVNSTANDLFFATDLNDEYASFMSSRENGKDEVTIYKIKLSEYSEQKVVMNPDLLANIATLNVGSNTSTVDGNLFQSSAEKPSYSMKYNKKDFPYFNFPVNNELTYHYLNEFKSSEAREVFIEAKNDQFNSDSLIGSTDELRKQLDDLEGMPHTILANKISKLEQKSFELGKQAENKLLKSQSQESDYLSKNIVGAVTLDVNTPSKKGQLIMSSETVPVANTIFDSEMTNKSKEGYVYHLQVGVFSNRAEPSFFSGLGEVKEEIVGNGKLYKYMVGTYSTFASAKKEIPEVRQLFPNTFVVAYKDGVKTSLGTAIKVTDQDYKHEPQTTTIVANVKSVSDVNDDKVNFRVQIGAYSGEVPQDVKLKLENFSKYSIYYSKDYRGYTICTVGNFDSYSKVSKLKMELREAGLGDAFTVAFSGNDKITIQQALEILRQ